MSGFCSWRLMYVRTGSTCMYVYVHVHIYVPHIHTTYAPRIET